MGMSLCVLIISTRDGHGQRVFFANIIKKGIQMSVDARKNGVKDRQKGMKFLILDK